MAELLVYNKEHWMDKLTQTEIDGYVKKYGDEWLAKYKRRYQKGDIVEVRPDGYFDKHGFNKKAFIVVKVGNNTVKLKDAEYLAKPSVEIKNAGTDYQQITVLKKRRYNIDTSKLSLTDNKAQVSKITDIKVTDKDNIGTING